MKVSLACDLLLGVDGVGALELARNELTCVLPDGDDVNSSSSHVRTLELTRNELTCVPSDGDDVNSSSSHVRRFCSTGVVGADILERKTSQSTEINYTVVSPNELTRLRTVAVETWGQLILEIDHHSHQFSQFSL